MVLTLPTLPFNGHTSTIPYTGELDGKAAQCLDQGVIGGKPKKIGTYQCHETEYQAFDHFFPAPLSHLNPHLLFYEVVSIIR